MAHFAELDQDNNVLRVIVVNNSELLDENNQESEIIGIQFCQDIFGHTTNWKQTSYNVTFRKNFAGIGSTYNATLDAFIPPKPFDSWILNETTCQWQPIVQYPNDGNAYYWNEELLEWHQYQMME